MPNKAKKFIQPKIVGVLLDGDINIPRQIARAFAPLKPFVALLAFEVEPRHLKKLVPCMQLMDIHGLMLTGRHRKEALKFLKRLHPSTKKTKSVDVVVRDKKGFIGISVEVGEFYQTCAKFLTPPSREANSL